MLPTDRLNDDRDGLLDVNRTEHALIDLHEKAVCDGPRHRFASTVLGPHLSIVVLSLMLLINSRSNFRACNMMLSGNYV
jgi:hypothetical protein